MKQWADIPWSELHGLFSVVICLDESMRIIYASDTVQRYLPEVQNNPILGEVFEVLRPGKLETFADAGAALNSLCLMTATSGRFAIRGQLLRTSYDEKEVFCLYGAPWLFWMSANCPDIRLRLNDFSAQDVQLDQLFFMTTEKQMVEDLENLNTTLTETKNELQQAHEAQHRFFAQMSHEMRTPLNGVVSALSLLESNPLDEKQDQLVGLAKSSSRNLMDVINYVLDLSKLELAGEDVEAAFDLPELIRSTIDILHAKAREKSLELRLELGPEAPQYITGNASRLRQVLLNLIMNAIKFTDRGSVTVSLLNGVGEAPNCTLKFTVTDTGMGIADDIKPHIFEPFWSLSPSGEDEANAGTGLGLDIVRRNVLSAGGDVGVTSEQGSGSTFWFDWPATVESAAPSVSSEGASATEPGSTNGISGRVLLVDDNQTNLLLGTMILESIGVDVSTAENGATAVAAATQGDFDLVLMDIHMPDFDGVEATRQIRKARDKKDLPIVALTALAYDKEKEACLESGMNGYLTKPIVKEALVAELATWMGSEAGSQPTDTVDHSDSGELETVALLDQAVLDELRRQIGEDNLKTVLAKVLAEAGQRWDELVTAESSGDRPAFQRHVHSLSSIFGSVGLLPAADALAAIEVQLRGGAEIDVAWIADLKKMKSNSLQALNQQLAALQAATYPN